MREAETTGAVARDALTGRLFAVRQVSLVDWHRRRQTRLHSPARGRVRLYSGTVIRVATFVRVEVGDLEQDDSREQRASGLETPARHGEQRSEMERWLNGLFSSRVWREIAARKLRPQNLLQRAQAFPGWWILLSEELIWTR